MGLLGGGNYLDPFAPADLELVWEREEQQAAEARRRHWEKVEAMAAARKASPNYVTASIELNMVCGKCHASLEGVIESDSTTVVVAPCRNCLRRSISDRFEIVPRCNNCGGTSVSTHVTYDCGMVKYECDHCHNDDYAPWKRQEESEIIRTIKHLEEKRDKFEKEWGRIKPLSERIQASAEQHGTRGDLLQLIRWLLETYDFDKATMEKLQRCLDGQGRNQR